MRVQRIKIRNFRGIEEKEIEFQPGMNLIIGENGKGKTSVLEAIAVGLGGFIAGIEGVATRHFSQQEIRRIYPMLGDGSIDEKKILPIEVETEAVVDGETFCWTRRRSSATASRTTMQSSGIRKKAEQMSQQEDVELPVILYESAARVWSQKREKTENVFRKNYYRTVGYTDALVDASNIKLLLNWCAKMEQVSWQKEMKIAEYEAAKKAVGDFMRRMNRSGECTIFYDKQTENLMYQSEGKTWSVEDLSSGYQSLVWMVFDIAYRMAVLNPEKKKKIAETSGVVLIDEIDMHLHPKWQWNILDALREVFPNVQFIAATHAPILFASAKNVWIADVEEEEIKYSWSHYGLDVNQTLNRYQETGNVTPPVQEQMDLFYQKVDEGQYDEAEQILAELEKDTAPEHPLLVQMRTTLELETMDLGE
ncbi:MAG: AAA family ATPase [Lachnospiraceae bacterium]|nr:AAA family ATPase [Lachnospiraceae bacterium]